MESGSHTGSPTSIVQYQFVAAWQHPATRLMASVVENHLSPMLPATQFHATLPDGCSVACLRVVFLSILIERRL